MGFRQNRCRRAKEKKKELKQSGVALASSSGENWHYTGRSVERSKSGGVVQFHQKKIQKMLSQGRVQVVSEDAGGKRIRLESGEEILVDSKMERVITYFGLS